MIGWHRRQQAIRMFACVIDQHVQPGVLVLELGRKIQADAQSEIDKVQREYYLREQLKAIQRELGESDATMQEADRLAAAPA